MIKESELPYFAEKIIEKLKRVQACFEGGQDTAVGRHWLDMLERLGLLKRVEIKPAQWVITDSGKDVLKRFKQGESNGD